jgi:hypothetical protein
MDRIARLCEEVRAFGGTAERTGVTLELRGLKAHKRTCTSLTDLVRKYKLYGDGLFYLPAGQWPEGEAQVSLDNVKWMGAARAFAARLRAERGRSRRRDDDDLQS